MLLSYFFILFHNIFISSHILLGELITFMAWLCSLCSVCMLKTLIAFCRCNTVSVRILFAATGRSTKISTDSNNIVCCNISHGLIFFIFPSTHSSPHFSRIYSNQELNIIKDLQRGTLFTLIAHRRKYSIHLHARTKLHTRKSDCRSES